MAFDGIVARVITWIALVAACLPPAVACALTHKSTRSSSASPAANGEIYISHCTYKQPSSLYCAYTSILPKGTLYVSLDHPPKA